MRTRHLEITLEYPGQVFFVYAPAMIPHDKLHLITTALGGHFDTRLLG